MRAATFWSNLIGYQLVWLAAVTGAGHRLAWPGVAAAGAFVLWQWLGSECRVADLRLLAVAIALGVLIDGTLAASGWATYAARTPALPWNGAPVWILALWASFSMTLNRSLASLRNRPVLAAALGALGAPLAYLGAQRGWHAVAFQAPAWRGEAWLSGAWAVATPTLALLARRWTRRGSGSADPPATGGL